MVRAAANGVEALVDLEHHRPSAILLDLMMPVLDGWSFLEHYQASADGTNLPIFVLSTAGVDREPLAALGATGFMQKPFDMDALVASHVGPPLHPPSPLELAPRTKKPLAMLEGCRLRGE